MATRVVIVSVAFETVDICGVTLTILVAAEVLRNRPVLLFFPIKVLLILITQMIMIVIVLTFRADCLTTLRLAAVAVGMLLASLTIQPLDVLQKVIYFPFL